MRGEWEDAKALTSTTRPLSAVSARTAALGAQQRHRPDHLSFALPRQRRTSGVCGHGDLDRVIQEDQASRAGSTRQ